jgi:hypothetical protein
MISLFAKISREREREVFLIGMECWVVEGAGEQARRWDHVIARSHTHSLMLFMK